MDQNREFCCNKSRLGVLKIPGGLDRSWETKRLQGLEMLGQSVELQKERSNQKNVFQENPAKKKSRHKKRHGTAVAKPDAFRDLHETDSNEIVKLRMQEDYVLKLEYHLQELSQQLIVERQKNRQEKLYIARLQQDLARLKSERPFKEILAKELEKEHKLRLEAEHRLSRLTVEYRSCKDRTLTLENDLKKMTDFAQGLSVYKSKLEEQQLDGGLPSASGLNRNAVHCDDGEKTKVLLERLRRLEAEKTSLVLENENQSQSYEKCLDEITGQVLEALMSQRSLKEECIKLQNRVFNLQQQNIHLRKVFHSQFILNPDASCLEQVMTAADGKSSKSKIRFPFMGVSLSSLNSVFSDQDQMSSLLSQINSPSIDLQDCLTETGAMDAVLSAALGRDCAAVRKEDEKEGEREGTSGKQSEKAPFLPNDNKATGNTFGSGGGSLMSSSDLNNPVGEWKSQSTFRSKFCPSLETESSNGGQTLERCSGAIQKFPNNKSPSVSSRKERTSGELLNQFRNEEEFSAEDFVYKKPSFGRSFDTLASEMNQRANVHLDTGSTVSLNELLDLAVIDLEDDPGTTLTEILPDHEEDQSAAETPRPLAAAEGVSRDAAGSSSSSSSFDVASDNVSIPKQSSHDEILPFPEHNIKMLLPDVCPDYRNLKCV